MCYDDDIVSSEVEYETSHLCCHKDGSLTNVTCGKQLHGCAAQCHDAEARLCPTGKCTGVKSDCNPKMGKKGFSSATLSSHNLRWCVKRGCPVRTKKICCYNPECFNHKDEKKRETCSHIHFLYGRWNRTRGGLFASKYTFFFGS